MKKTIHLIAAFALAVIPFLIFYGSGVWGINFGFHWDEDKILALVERTIKSGVFLPRWYKYPSVSYWLGIGTLFPYLRGAFAQVGLDVHTLRTYLQQVVQAPRFLLQMRQVFLFVSSLSVFWVFGAVWLLRRKLWEAFCAACLLGLSWEVAYHARWVAPDAIMMQFAALTLFCIAMALQVSPKWGIAAAFFGGVACSTKYPAGLLFIPILFANIRVHDTASGYIKAARGLAYTLLPFFGGYLLMTPGTLLDPLTFFKDIAYEMRHYQGAYDVQYIAPGFEHFGAMFIYLAFVLSSHYPGIAALIFLCALVGGWTWLRESLTVGAVLMAFPVIYIAYFSLQQVMAVRNYLVLAPFLALFAGRDITFLGETIEQMQWLRLWYSIILALFTINAVWLLRAAQSIVNYSPAKLVNETKQVLLAHQERMYWLSDRVWKDLGAEKLSLNAARLTGKEDFCNAQEHWMLQSQKFIF